MTVAAVHSTRWQRAQAIDSASIRPLGQNTYLVPSQSTDRAYRVLVTLDDGNNITARSCTCPDFTKHRGVEHLCKHIIASAGKAWQQKLTKEERPMTISVIPEVTFTVKPFPQPGTTVWDEDALERCMHDEDGDVYWGDSPAACLAQYDKQMRRAYPSTRAKEAPRVRNSQRASRRRRSAGRDRRILLVQAAPTA